jgi:hypothetical protein
MASKRSSTDERTTLWKEYMVRNSLRSIGERINYKVPKDEVTMLIVEFKSKEDEHIVRGFFSSTVESMEHVSI